MRCVLGQKSKRRRRKCMWLDQGWRREGEGGRRETGAGTRNFIFCNFRDNVILSTTFCLTSPSVASQHLQLQPPAAALPLPTSHFHTFCYPSLYKKFVVCIRNFDA